MVVDCVIPHVDAYFLMQLKRYSACLLLCIKAVDMVKASLLLADILRPRDWGQRLQGIAQLGTRTVCSRTSCHPIAPASFYQSQDGQDLEGDLISFVEVY